MTTIKDCVYSFFSGLKGNSRSATVKKNILGSFGVKGISIIISLILVPLTIDYVSSELYGIWLTIATIISWVSLFDLGFGHGLRNRVAECVAIDNWEEARCYISTAYIYFTIIFVSLAIIVFCGCEFVYWPTVLNVSSSSQDLLVKVMRVVTVAFSISMIVTIQNTVLAALQMKALADFFDMLGQVVVLFSTYALTLFTKPSLEYLAWAVSASPIIVHLFLSIWIYGIKYKKLCPSLGCVKSVLIKKVLNLGLNFFVIQIAVIILYQTMNIIISNVAGPEAVTEYNVVYKYISIPLMVTSIIVAPFWSAFTDAYTLNDVSWMKNAYSKLMRIYGIGVIGVFLVTACSPLAFKLWIGDKVVIHPFLVITCACYVLIMMWNSIHSALINGIGYIRLSLYITLISIVLNIPVAFFLGRFFGAAGVVMSVGSMNLLGMVAMYIQINKIINGTAKGIWKK